MCDTESLKAVYNNRGNKRSEKPRLVLHILLNGELILECNYFAALTYLRPSPLPMNEFDLTACCVSS